MKVKIYLTAGFQGPFLFKAKKTASSRASILLCSTRILLPQNIVQNILSDHVRNLYIHQFFEFTSS